MEGPPVTFGAAFIYSYFLAQYAHLAYQKTV